MRGEFMRFVFLFFACFALVLSSCADDASKESDSSNSGGTVGLGTGSGSGSGLGSGTGVGTASAPGPGKGRPADKYACNINGAGYCIFTGKPHNTGLKPGTTNIVDRDGKYLFSMKEAVAANSAGKVLAAKGTPAFDGDEMIQSS